jgi:hypothetical protein
MSNKAKENKGLSPKVFLKGTVFYSLTISSSLPGHSFKMQGVFIIGEEMSNIKVVNV